MLPRAITSPRIGVRSGLSAATLSTSPLPATAEKQRQHLCLAGLAAAPPSALVPCRRPPHGYTWRPLTLLQSAKEAETTGSGRRQLPSATVTEVVVAACSGQLTVGRAGLPLLCRRQGMGRGLAGSGADLTSERRDSRRRCSGSGGG